MMVDPDACVVLFGSWGRRELTDGSDADWAILVDGGAREKIKPDVLAVKEAIAADERGPGTQGTFGGVVFCDHLVKRIGLKHDDNKNLTMRMLLLLESVAVINATAHVACRERVLHGYLDDSVKGYRPPRFLLNDLIRYWRTICVDFVGKERAGTGEKWALRNLKLGLSRKALERLAAGSALPSLCRRGHPPVPCRDAGATRTRPPRMGVPRTRCRRCRGASPWRLRQLPRAAGGGGGKGRARTAVARRSDQISTIPLGQAIRHRLSAGPPRAPFRDPAQAAGSRIRDLLSWWRRSPVE